MMLSEVGVFPSISQIAAAPASFCHKISDLPSPLKSPVAIVCQLGGGVPMTLSEVGVCPSISQIAAAPASFCHRMSDLPSPLKSPVAIVCQLGGGVPMMLSEVGVFPSISQMATAPASFCHRMSDLPSPLKSVSCVSVAGALKKLDVIVVVVAVWTVSGLSTARFGTVVLLEKVRSTPFIVSALATKIPIGLFESVILYKPP